MKSIILFCLIFNCVFIAGCGTPFSDGSGYEWGHTGAGSFDNDPFNLAPFGSPLIDGNGILYTLRCGTIDPDHIYGWARKTKSYYDALYACLIRDCGKLSKGYFDMSFEYPDSWQTMTLEDKKEASHKIALEVAQFLSFNDGLWHELATWYGHRTFPLISDFQSAFSWEDMYSNRLGIDIAARAIEMQGDFAKNVSLVTKRELAKRELVDTERARNIAQTMRNEAYKDDPLAKKILWRSLDIGSSDGQINPVVFPGFTDKPPIPLPAPKLDILDTYEINVKVVVSKSSPKYDTIRSKSNMSDPLEPLIHNEKILSVVKEDALKRGFRVFD